MVYKKVVFSFIIFLTLFTSCNTNEPDNTPANIEFAAEDASCTEAWIKLEADNIKAAQVFREDSLIYSFNTNSIDTVLYDEGLLPNQSYKYKLTIQHPLANGNNSSVSKELTLQTMDTTSHNFTWQTFTFGGEAGSSVLNDVAIIDENNIWAVGEIYMNDSLGNPDPHSYNAVHWDGNEWELKRIYTYSACSSIDYAPLKAIYAFSQNNLVVTSGGGMWWFDGRTWNAECKINPLLTGAINKLWGSSSNELYAVGTAGNIVCFNGTAWNKIQTNSIPGYDSLTIKDIYGVNTPGGETEIIIAGNKLPWSLEFFVGKIKNGEVTPVYLGDIQNVNPKHSVYSVNRRKYYLAGTNIHSKNSLDTEKNWKLERSSWARIECIRGTGYNHIFAAGHFGWIWHYNGIQWLPFSGKTGVTNGYFTSLSMKNNVTAFCGLNNNKAVITMAKK